VVPLGGVAVRERAFNAQPWEVRAILAGTKTQTRRLVRPVRGYEHNNVCRPDMAADPWAVWWHGMSERVGCLQTCPYGVPGDRLWCKERHWRFTGCAPAPSAFVPAPDGDPYQARCYDDYPELESLRASACLVRVPSIHMPRWASRLTLEVTDVRVQRLAEISKADAIAEGATRREWAKAPAGWSACGWSVDWSRVGTLSRYAGGIHKRGHEQPLTERDICLGSPQMAFASEWERHYGGKSASWYSTPFVWAVTFSVVPR
jgi:hypothetical protein